MSEAPGTVRDLLERARTRLSAAGLPDARLDAELLLLEVLPVDRVQLITHPDREVDPEAIRRFEALVEQRSEGCPLAYLRGRQEFFSLDFEVSPAVLIPRPETELLVEGALEFLTSRPGAPRVADVCTGSGCIAVSIAVGEPRAEVHAVDLSPDALAVARRNAARHRCEERITFHLGDLTAPLSSRFDVIVSNPPYVAFDDPRLEEGVARHEPEMAYRDLRDRDGLGFYRALAGQCERHLRPGGVVLLEVGDGQARDVGDLFTREHGSWRVDVQEDLAGIERVVRIASG